MTHTVGELAARLGLPVRGDPEVEISGVAGLREAVPGDLSFLAHGRYFRLMEETQASAVIVPEEYAGSFGGACLLSPVPSRSFQQVVLLFALPLATHPDGVHPTAVIAPDAVLGREVGIGPHVVIEAGARIGDRSRLWAGCFLGAGSELGDDCILYPGVSIREHCRVGHRAIFHSGVVIGSDGFGFETDAAGRRTKVPQLGGVTIGNDVELGANVTVDRARFGQTRIGNDVKVDNLVQIAHNVVLEDRVVLVAQAGIAGSTLVGRNAIIGGQVGIAGHLVIGPDAMVGAQAGVTKDVAPGARVSGYPAVPHEKSAQLQAHVNRLPRLKKRVAELEQRLQELEQRLAKTGEA